VEYFISSHPVDRTRRQAINAYTSTFLSHPVVPSILLLQLYHSPPLDNIWEWAMMIVWRIRGKIYQNCSVLYYVTQKCCSINAITLWTNAASILCSLVDGRSRQSTVVDGIHCNWLQILAVIVNARSTYLHLNGNWMIVDGSFANNDATQKLNEQLR